nr:hypothetical protein CFP56_44107 [Quercus suber]
MPDTSMSRVQLKQPHKIWVSVSVQVILVKSNDWSFEGFTSHSLWASPITMNWSLPSKSVSACVYLAFLNPLVILIISRSIPYYKQRFLIVLSSPSQMKHKLQLL